MKKYKQLFTAIFLTSLSVIAYGQEYNSVTIGGQRWMTENLNVTRFRNGDPIPEAQTAAEWERAWNNHKPAWCYYKNNSENGEKYGKLYNGYAVADPRGLAPEGWRIPSESDWDELINYLRNEPGTQLKSKIGWDNSGNGSNSSGFSAFPGGWRHYKSEFDYAGLYGQWWSSTQVDVNYLWTRKLSATSVQIFRGNPEGKDRGMSVRCLKNQ